MVFVCMCLCLRDLFIAVSPIIWPLAWLMPSQRKDVVPSQFVCKLTTWLFSTSPFLFHFPKTQHEDWRMHLAGPKTSGASCEYHVETCWPPTCCEAVKITSCNNNKIRVTFAFKLKKYTHTQINTLTSVCPLKSSFQQYNHGILWWWWQERALNERRPLTKTQCHLTLSLLCWWSDEEKERCPFIRKYNRSFW